jgi:tryptophan synthase beta chain
MPNRPQPVLHPGTGEPVGPDDLAPLFPMELILQEVSTDAEVAIPDEVRDIYRLWRPTPLYRAERLEQRDRHEVAHLLQVRGRQPGGEATSRTPRSRRPSTTKPRGASRLSTETGAGQWGSALAFACKLVGLECKVYMVKVSYEQKPFRRSLMHVWGAEIVASPSEDTQAGARSSRSTRTPGSLGIAISEAVEDAAAATTPRTRSAACSTTCCCTRR